MDMIERVARALCELDIRTKRRYDTLPEDSERILPEAVDYHFRQYTDAARATIQAMREPSDGMKVAIVTCSGTSFIECYYAAIDAALGEG